MNSINEFANGIAKVFWFVLADRNRFLILIGILGIVVLPVLFPYTWNLYPRWKGETVLKPLVIESDNKDMTVTVFVPEKLIAGRNDHRFRLEIKNYGTEDLQALIEIHEDQTYINFVDVSALPIKVEREVPAGTTIPIELKFEVLEKNLPRDPARFIVRAYFDEKLDWGRHIFIPIDFITIPFIAIVIAVVSVLTVGTKAAISIWKLFYR